MRFSGSRTSSSRDFLDVTTPAPRENWQRLVDHSDKALITQTPGWLDCICATDSYDDASRFYEFGNSGGIVVPLARRRGWPGRLIAQDAWPSEWGIGAPVTAEAPDPRHVRAVFEDLARLPSNRVSVRFGPDTDPVWLSSVPSASPPCATRRTSWTSTAASAMSGGTSKDRSEPPYARARRQGSTWRSTAPGAWCQPSTRSTSTRSPVGRSRRTGRRCSLTGAGIGSTRCASSRTSRRRSRSPAPCGWPRTKAGPWRPSWCSATGLTPSTGGVAW